MLNWLQIVCHHCKSGYLAYSQYLDHLRFSACGVRQQVKQMIHNTVTPEARGMFTPSFTPRGEHSLLFRRMEGRTENITHRR
jgi:hypothetical protein